MTDIIIHKHSITANDVPTASEVGLGELAIQAADGHIYLKRTDGAVIRVTMLPGGGDQQVLYKTGSGDYALGWGTISSTLMGGTLWNEVVAEVQRVFELVEGTASVLLSAPATLTAGSTGPITVSVADANYLADGTSITGVLGTVYGTLSRSGTTYSFVSNQSYTSNVTFATGTRFAAAFLNDTFNPLRIGSAQVEDDNSYAESGYVYAMLDAAGRLAWGVKADGSLEINRVGLDSADTKLLNILQGGANSGEPVYADRYAHVVVDENDRLAYGVRKDGSVEFGKTIKGSVAFTEAIETVTEEHISGGDFGYLSVQLDTQDRISEATLPSGSKFFPKCEIDQATIKTLNVETINNQQQIEPLTVDDAASVIVEWGDSMTEDMPADILQAKLEALSGRPRIVLNRGAGGQKRDQVMGRQGTKDVAVAIFGGTIPASTSIDASVSVSQGSTGPISLTLADANYLALGTSQYAALADYRGELSRSAQGSYSFIFKNPASQTTLFQAGTGLALAVEATASPDVISHINYDIFCHLAGVEGVLDQTVSANKIFLRLEHGPAVAVANGTIAVVNPSKTVKGSKMFLNNGTTIILPSINSSYAESVTEDSAGNIVGTPELDDTLKMIAKVRNPFDRCLILSIRNGRQAAKPSSLYDQDQTRIRILREAFGNRFYDLRFEVIKEAKQWFQTNYPTQYAQTWFKTYIDIGSGTSFPASPRDGDIFTRTDEGQRYIYDATAISPEWLPTTENAKASVNQTDFTGGINGSDWDVQTGDTVPRALRRDDIHANSYGKELICELLAAKLHSLGW
jgi:hypothetical protein